MDFFKTIPQPDGKNEIVEWIDHNTVPELVLDHFDKEKYEEVVKNGLTQGW